MKDNVLYTKIKVMSNQLRFRILELTQEHEWNISDLSSKLKLSYTKCADYVTMLEKERLVEKIPRGKEVKVKSKVKLFKDRIEFS